MITPILLCGGSGTRLWPLSRIGNASFLEADLRALIQDYLGEDARLHRAALADDDWGVGR